MQRMQRLLAAAAAVKRTGVDLHQQEWMTMSASVSCTCLQMMHAVPRRTEHEHCPGLTHMRQAFAIFRGHWKYILLQMLLVDWFHYLRQG